jgi:hypothetical protein
MITANNLVANALERFDDGVDDGNGVNVTFDDAVDAQAYDVASGITTSGTSVDFANFALRAKQTLRDSTSSVNLPITFYVLLEYWARLLLSQLIAMMRLFRFFVA